MSREVLQLAIFYTLHLIATLVWLGGLITLVLISWPGAIGTTPEGKAFVEAMEKRLRPFAGGSMFVLLVSGFVQMGSDPNYLGLFQFGNLWSAAMLMKHVVFTGMLLVSGVSQYRIIPDLERAHIASNTADITNLRGRLQLMTRLNLGLGIVVLILTAIMTAVP